MSLSSLPETPRVSDTDAAAPSTPGLTGWAGLILVLLMIGVTYWFLPARMVSTFFSLLNHL